MFYLNIRCFVSFENHFNSAGIYRVCQVLYFECLLIFPNLFFNTHSALPDIGLLADDSTIVPDTFYS